jgi:hypothetical protein
MKTKWHNQRSNQLACNAGYCPFSTKKCIWAASACSCDPPASDCHEINNPVTCSQTKCAANEQTCSWNSFSLTCSCPSLTVNSTIITFVVEIVADWINYRIHKHYWIHNHYWIYSRDNNRNNRDNEWRSLENAVNRGGKDRERETALYVWIV